jgi:hypothetical protein
MVGPGDGDEAWDFDVVADDGGLAAYATLVLRRDEGRAWWWSALVGDGRPLVTVVDLDVPTPRGRSLEIRTEGLWAEIVVEAPGEHWSVGLEAFALGVDDPDEALGAQRGDRVALGFDLGWETDGDDGRCRVHGEVLVGSERLAVDGSPGTQRHRTGGDAWRQILTGAPTIPHRVLHRAPVLVVTGDGRRHRVERAVCRLDGADAVWASWVSD